MCIAHNKACITFLLMVPNMFEVKHFSLQLIIIISFVIILCKKNLSAWSKLIKFRMQSMAPALAVSQWLEYL